VIAKCFDCLLVIALVVAFIAHSPSKPAQAEEEVDLQRYFGYFSHLDKDHNGAVSFSEYYHDDLKATEEHFRGLDVNKDGFLHSQEMPNKTDFKKYDHNRDKFITYDEYSRMFKTKWKKDFRKWDKNGNGFLSLKEYAFKEYNPGKKKDDGKATPYPNNPYGEHRF
jgi:Ca2+-binding EF-hand superfamily protein